MVPTFEFDMRQFNRALEEYFQSTQRSLADVLNQRALNVAGRAFDNIKPASENIESQRAKVRGYLSQPVSTRIKLFRGGKRKGRFGKKGSRNNQLQRVHLIVQARRAKAGKKGLYGAAMRAVSGRFKQKSSISVGFLKSAFLPIIIGLNAVARFKSSFSRTGTIRPKGAAFVSRIARWPGSDGFGKVNPAKPGWNPFVSLLTRWKISDAEYGKVSTMTRGAVQAAFNAEAAEMTRHVAAKLQEDANRVNAR